MLFQRLTVAILAVAVSANDVSPVKREIPASHVVHERQMDHWAMSWSKRSKVPDSTLLPMRIGLKQSNLEQGRSLLAEISNPKSDKYGQHMSVDEVTDLFSPTATSVTTVKEWLVSGGIASGRIVQSTNKQWLAFDATASEVESLLLTEFHIYEHSATQTQNVAAEEYYVPADIREHVDYITPGIRLRVDPGKAKQLKRRVVAENLRKRGFASMNTGAIPIELPKSDARLPSLPPLNYSNCNKYVTNQCVRNQYRVPKNTKAAPGNELGIFESLNDHYNREDLDVFFTHVQPEVPNGTYPIDHLIDGATGASATTAEAGVESDLDFEAAIPMIYPQKTILFQTDDQFIEINQTGNTPYLGFWNTFFDAIDGSYCTYSAYGETGNCDKPECLDPQYPDPNPGGYKGQLMCGTYKPTNVISISYGGGEGDLPAYYLKRQCDEIMKLGLQGVTVVISSGDDGVGSYPGDGGPNGCAGPTGKIFYPATDASCPYVLAVGSTQFVNATAASGLPKCKLAEVATTSFPSGGGFSNVFDVADYQKDAVKHYFDTVPLSFSGYAEAGTNFSTAGNGVYRIGGRGYPDVAAIGDRFVIRTQGIWATVGGTSLSAPIWASLLTLVNEERIAAGKPTVGFVNPVLYAHPEVFTDITVGSNPNCNSTGFLAAKGWDPVTGLGSPKYPKLLALLNSL